MSRPSVAVAVIVYNSFDEATVCIQSCLDSDYADFAVVVLDNGSTDNSGRRLAAEFASDERVRVITKTPNQGFSGGFNRATSEALATGADYVWVLADDVRVAPDAMSRLVKALEHDPHIGVAGQVMYHSDERRRIYYAGGRLSFHGVSYDIVESCHEHQDETDDGTVLDNSAAETDFITGASMFFRATALGETGGMDPDYWLYWEDVDLSWRVHLAGWKVVVVHGAKSWHEVTNPSDDSQRIRERYAIRNELMFTLKYQKGFSRAGAVKFLWRLSRERGFRVLWSDLPLVRGTYDFLLGRKGRLPENW